MLDITWRDLKNEAIIKEPFSFNPKKKCYIGTRNLYPSPESTISVFADDERDIERIAALFTYKGQVTIPIHILLSQEYGFTWPVPFAQMITSALPFVPFDEE
ncbi:MAG: hypothetical protein WCJ51_01510 [Candidatus Moraniibacteriota bacterium]